MCLFDSAMIVVVVHEVPMVLCLVFSAVVVVVVVVLFLRFSLPSLFPLSKRWSVVLVSVWRHGGSEWYQAR